MPPRCLVVLASLVLSGCAWFRPHPPVYDAVDLGAGLVVRDLVVPMEGPGVADGDTVAIHYELRLPDKSLIENSRNTGLPLRFQVGAGKVPRGLEQGVVGMRLYGRRRIIVPPALAYGDEGHPPAIPPGSALTFDVEVMELEPLHAAPAP